MTAGVDFFAELEARDPRADAKPKMLVDRLFPRTPTGAAVRRSRVLSKESSPLRRSTISWSCTISPTRHRVSTTTVRVDQQVPRRARRGGRVLHHVEELQHGRLAHRLHGRQQGPGARARPIKSYHDYGSFTPIQVASIVALEDRQECVEQVRKTYQKRRDVMVKGLH